MEQYVVAISIDKVQSFLYYVLQAAEQEKQSNSGTLKTIIGSSRLISEDFYEEVGLEGDRGPFFLNIDLELLKCSGMCVFVTSLSEAELISKLDQLFHTYYLKLNGQLLLKYVFFKPSFTNGNMDRLQAIKESKRLLNKKSCLNSIIARNTKTLFQFHAIDNRETQKPQKTNSIDFDAFAETINSLYSEQEVANNNHFRIAVIKADLDGMGDLFRGLQHYEEYCAISELLSEYISIQHLHQQVTNFKKKDSTFKVYPLYIAGDDIFIAVPVSKLVAGVNLCKSILNELNQKLMSVTLPDGKVMNLNPLSMSIGIEFTFNREPIRYYYNRVQEQLDVAKKASLLTDQETVNNLCCIKISMNNYVFYDYQLDAEKDIHEKFKEANRDKSQWHHFVSQVQRVQHAMKEGFAAHHFFYGLLEKITHDDIYNNKIRYSNALLYHVIPQYQNSMNKTLKELELLIIESLVQQVIKVKPSSVRGRTEGELSFTTNEKKRLENYVRLLLLFSDPRFQMIQIKPKHNRMLDKDLKRIRSTIFNKTLRYLYKQNLCTGTKNDLRAIFIKHTSYKKSDDINTKRSNTKSNQVEVYRILPLSTSLLHRLKTITDRQKVAKLIEATNPQTQEEIKLIEQERDEEHKAPPKLYFDKTEFLKVTSSLNVWKNDYIDSLLIFYQLREQLIQFRVESGLNPSTVKNSNKGANKNRRKFK